MSHTTNNCTHSYTTTTVVSHPRYEHFNMETTREAEIFFVQKNVQSAWTGWDNKAGNTSFIWAPPVARNWTLGRICLLLERLLCRICCWELEIYVGSVCCWELDNYVGSALRNHTFMWDLPVIKVNEIKKKQTENQMEKTQH